MSKEEEQYNGHGPAGDASPKGKLSPKEENDDSGSARSKENNSSPVQHQTKSYNTSPKALAVSEEASNYSERTDNQGLNIEVSGDGGNQFSINGFWQGASYPEETNVFTGFQPSMSMGPLTPQSYGLNNNNSFHQPLHYGSIGQPFGPQLNSAPPFGPSPPAMHGMPMMNNLANPVSSYGFQQNHPNQNQRRAITAQHNYNTLGNKPGNMRLPWGNHPNPWPNGNQAAMSPWTIALQQQKMNRGMNSAPMKKSPMYNGNPPPMNIFPQQQKFRRTSPLPGPAMMRAPQYGPEHAVDSNSQIHLDATNYQAQPNTDINSLSNQFMDMMRPNTENGADNQRGYEASIEQQFASGDDINNTPIVTDHPILTNGSLPQTGAFPFRPETYSRKVFVGGLPPDIDEDEITASFRQFGIVAVDWPHKAESKSYFPPKGYCFLLFQEEISVQRLIDSCHQDDNKFYWCVTSPTMKDKPVQIRPWKLSDSDFVKDGSQSLDPRKTIFVGGVPRPLRAVELAFIIDNLYGGVCYAGIDTDPDLKYPKGAGRVAFSNQQSYIAAISARFVQLQHGDIDKRVEVKPYVLDDQSCDECQGARCNEKSAPFFCANVTCLQYYCEQCWGTIHSRPGREFHKPLVKEGADRPRAVPFRWC